MPKIGNDYEKKEKKREYNRVRTFEKWYPSGTDILILRLPSLDEPPGTTTVSVSEDRLRSRFIDLDFGTGG